MGSLERVICFPKIGDLSLAKIGAGGKPLVGDSLRTFGPHEKNLSIFDKNIRFIILNSNKALRTHWDGNQLRFMRFPPVGINNNTNLKHATQNAVNEKVQAMWLKQKRYYTENVALLVEPG